MQTECDKALKQIIQGFRECQNAFTAIGDELGSLFCLCCWKVTCLVFE